MLSSGSAFALDLHTPVCLMPFLSVVISVAKGSWRSFVIKDWVGAVLVLSWRGLCR
jgi:hypothetical protein